MPVIKLLLTLLETSGVELAPAPFNIDLVLLKEEPQCDNPKLNISKSNVHVSNSTNPDNTDDLLSDLLPVMREAESKIMLILGEVGRLGGGGGACGTTCVLI